jgi:hypothetical protein
MERPRLGTYRGDSYGDARAKEDTPEVAAELAEHATDDELSARESS